MRRYRKKLGAYSSWLFHAKLPTVNKLLASEVRTKEEGRGGIKRNKCKRSKIYILHLVPWSTGPPDSAFLTCQLITLPLAISPAFRPGRELSFLADTSAPN